MSEGGYYKSYSCSNDISFDNIKSMIKADV